MSNPRCSTGSEALPACVVFAGYTLDFRARLLQRAGHSVHLQPKVMELLLHLVANHERFVSKRELQATLWQGVVVGDASLPRLVKELRRALGDAADNPRLVRTVHGRGYQFVADVVPSLARGTARFDTQARRLPGAAPEVRAHGSAEGGETLDAALTASHAEQADEVRTLELRTLHPRGLPSARLCDGDRLSIGRGAENALVIGSERASRQHAEITREGPAFALRDLTSRNGTFVNGSRIVRPWVLRPFDLLRIGEWVGVVAWTEPAAPPSPEAHVGVGSSALEACCVGSQLWRALRTQWRPLNQASCVLIEGESGSGKSCLARALLRGSASGLAPLTLDCAYATPAQLEHALRALNAVKAGRPGPTLLLEHVDALSMALQGTLARELLNTEKARIQSGAQGPRLIATSRLSLQVWALRGLGRPDLCERLSGHVLTLPALRRRWLDVPELLQHFLRACADERTPAVSARLVEALCLYGWPSNVRELEQTVQRLLREHRHKALLSRRHLAAPLLAAVETSIHAARRPAAASSLTSKTTAPHAEARARAEVH